MKRKESDAKRRERQKIMKQQAADVSRSEPSALSADHSKP